MPAVGLDVAAAGAARAGAAAAAEKASTTAMAVDLNTMDAP
jgi:hypothetical protein